MWSDCQISSDVKTLSVLISSETVDIISKWSVKKYIVCVETWICEAAPEFCIRCVQWQCSGAGQDRPAASLPTVYGATLSLHNIEQSYFVLGPSSSHQPLVKTRLGSQQWGQWTRYRGDCCKLCARGPLSLCSEMAVSLRDAAVRVASSGALPLPDMFV